MSNSDDKPPTSFQEFSDRLARRRAEFEERLSAARERIEASREGWKQKLAAMTPERRAELKQKLADAGITKEAIAEKIAQVQAGRNAFNEKVNRMSAERAEREATVKLLQRALKEANQTFGDNLNALRAYHRAIGEAAVNRTGMPTPPELKYVNFREVETLLAAAHDSKTPFPPEHLAQQWANFKANRSDK